MHMVSAVFSVLCLEYFLVYVRSLVCLPYFPNTMGTYNSDVSIVSLFHIIILNIFLKIMNGLSSRYNFLAFKKKKYSTNKCNAMFQCVSFTSLFYIKGY